MGKISTPLGKLSRREGVALSNSTSIIKVMQRRPYVPGVHGKAGGFAPKISVFGQQLREKQKAKRLYGLMEKQFRNYFTKAAAKDGNTGDNLAQFLEMRLDNVVFRMGFAKTRAQARQMVSHAMMSINGATNNIPSYQVKVGEVIEIRATKAKKKLFSDLSERLKTHTAPGWLFRESDIRGKIVSLPQGDELVEVYDPKLIVEFYSMR